ncbi:MAG TPA: hypothetical protein ENJ35_04320 [Gammaproteobacteria bacterium]|nr:hypothetical protein [Gammaproteobacteria bacterium]
MLSKDDCSELLVDMLAAGLFPYKVSRGAENARAEKMLSAGCAYRVIHGMSYLGMKVYSADLVTR